MTPSLDFPSKRPNGKYDLESKKIMALEWIKSTGNKWKMGPFKKKLLINPPEFSVL